MATISPQQLNMATPQFSSDLQHTLSQLDGSISEDVKEQFAHGNDTFSRSHYLSNLNNTQRFQSSYTTDSNFFTYDLSLPEDDPAINSTHMTVPQMPDNKLSMSLMTMDGSTSLLNLKFNTNNSLSNDQTRIANDDNIIMNTTAEQHFSILG